MISQLYLDSSHFLALFCALKWRDPITAAHRPCLWSCNYLYKHGNPRQLSLLLMCIGVNESTEIGEVSAHQHPCAYRVTNHGHTLTHQHQ